jgi:hypothetical protein
MTSLIESLLEGLGLLLESIGVTSPAKKRKPAPKPPPRADSGK